MKNKFFKPVTDEGTGTLVEKIDLFKVHKWHCKLIKKHGNPISGTSCIYAEIRQNNDMLSASITIFDTEDNRTLTVYDFSKVQSFIDHKLLIDSLFLGALSLNQIP